MILKTFDGKEIYVSKAQSEKIAAAMQGGVKLIQVAGCMLAPGAIASIVPGGDALRQTPEIAAKHQETDSEREARYGRNRIKLAEMKQNLIKKGVIKKEGEPPLVKKEIKQ